MHTLEQDVNMASKRVILVNEASLVDLKAELYRQETQSKREKVDSSKFPKKAPIWQRKKKESKKNVKKNVEKLSSDNSYDNELEKSRLMLEAKSALYEKLSNGEIEVPSDEDDQEGRFLVDFHKKTNPKEKEGEDKIGNSSEMMPSASSAADEWVDYVDSFGRSRKCLRQDLPIMKEKDEKMQENASQKDTSSLTLLSDDMRREIIRKKWEKEVEETLDKPVGPVHYQDVLSNETRDHGVGYYTFSKVEEERQEQQTTLKNLRAQTEQHRNNREMLLEKRKAAMDARLAKVRERKLKKLKEQGLASTDDKEDTSLPREIISEEDGRIRGEQDTPSSKDENDLPTDDNEDRIKNKIARMENSHSNKWEKSKINLEVFDKPKLNIISKQDPRNERNPDFAPPSFYTMSENEKRNLEKKGKWKDIDSGFREDYTTNKTNNLWESQSTKHDPAILMSQSLTYNDSYPQETTSSTNVPQVHVPPCQPPPVPPYPVTPNQPPINILPDLLPPPTHAFPPPQPFSFPPPMYPPQFPTYCNDYTTNIPYPPPPPGVHYYPPVPPPGYPHYANITSTKIPPPGPL